MSTLIVAATAFEVAALIERECHCRVEGLGNPGTLFEGTKCDVLVTGVGQVPCTFHLHRALSRGLYTQIVQAGIAGSFTAELPIGSVVVVHEEFFADIGAEDNGRFLDLFDMGLLGRDVEPFTGGGLVAPSCEFTTLSELRSVRSVSVNRTLSDPRSISWVRERYSPDVVNMEGAAFFYVCRSLGVRFGAIRAISDMVGPRNKDTWKVSQAVASLDEVLDRLIDELDAGEDTLKGF